MAASLKRFLKSTIRPCTIYMFSMMAAVSGRARMPPPGLGLLLAWHLPAILPASSWKYQRSVRRIASAQHCRVAVVLQVLFQTLDVRYANLGHLS
mmetsp:Transcript_9949/g.22383  ORF Transcript_9949/g.22383 Transcript_9949/m.22383 type:complete len:95 (+) Transcript_9949:117-401(+)